MNLTEELALRSKAVRHHESELRDYQRDLAIPFAMKNPFSGLYIDMGLGKTVSCLTVLNKLFTADKCRKALVIAPLRVAVQTWPTEIREWSHTWWMTHTVIRPDYHHPGIKEAMTKARAKAREDWDDPVRAAQAARTKHLELQRRKLARRDTMIHIINREAVDWLVKFYGENWPYDAVIVDESTSFSDHNSKRWIALNSVRKHMKRLHLLSGVPAPEGIQDYFAQVYLLDRGERFGRGITHFRKTYMFQSYASKFKYEPRPGADKEVASKISDICLVMREEDYLPLDKPVVVQRPIILEPHEMRMYRKFERELILQLSDDVEIEAENAAALAQKLLQFASGAVYDGDRVVHAIHDHKLDEIMELREEARSPMLIAYWHRSSLTRLRKRLPKAVVMDKEGDCVKEWNAGRIQDLLIHPASAGHGLNMQLGPGHHLTFFDNPYALELYMQTIKRLARPGQKKIVKVFHLTTMGTVDALIVPLLRQKEDAQDVVRRYIRDMRKRFMEKKNV